jgi:3-methyladenine DNA glycosylase AlkD
MSAAAELIAHLRSLHSARNVEGQQRFGIRSTREQLGIAIPVLRKLARPHRRDHALAQELWHHEIQEARILATFVEDPRTITRRQMEQWVRVADNWALTDALAFLFDRTEFAAEKAHAWSARKAEFVKRTGFAIMAGMATHRKELLDDVFLSFLPVIAREATDERNFVRKAVNWALRGIGKRNPRLRRAAIAEATRIAKLDARAARWIANDALRELATDKLEGGCPHPPSTRGEGTAPPPECYPPATANCPHPAAISIPRRCRTVLGSSNSSARIF